MSTRLAFEQAPFQQKKLGRILTQTLIPYADQRNCSKECQEGIRVMIEVMTMVCQQHL
jgi:hypothetical protein